MICNTCDTVLELPESLIRGTCAECSIGDGKIEFLDAEIRVEDVYGGPCRCGYGFLARNDTSLCEWCTAGLPPGRQYRSYSGPLPSPAKGSSATFLRKRTDSIDAEGLAHPHD